MFTYEKYLLNVAYWRNKAFNTKANSIDRFICVEQVKLFLSYAAKARHSKIIAW